MAIVELLKEGIWHEILKVGVITAGVVSCALWLGKRLRKAYGQIGELQRVLDCSPNCIFLLKKNLECERVRGMGGAFLGKDESQLIGRSFLDMWPENERAALEKKITSTHRGDQLSFRANYAHPDGHMMQFLVVCGPLYDEKGNPTKTACTLVDITHLQKIQEEMSERLETEKTLAGVTTAFMQDELGRQALQNGLAHVLKALKADRISWYENFTTKTGELAAKSMYSAGGGAMGIVMWKSSSQEKLLNYGRFAGKWESLLGGGKKMILSVIKSPEEEKKYLVAEGVASALVLPVMNNGQWTGFVRIDHTSKDHAWQAGELRLAVAACEVLQENIVRFKTRQSLRLLSAAVETVEEGIVISEASAGAKNSKIVFVNSAACSLSGYGPEELIGQPILFLERSKKEGAESLAEKIDLAMQAGGSSRCEVVSQKKDGKTYLTTWNLRPIKSSKGEVTNYVSILRDVTEERELQSRASLSSKLESIGQLAAGIAHEINTPSQFISDNLYYVKESWARVAEKIKEPEAGLKKIVEEIPQALTDALEGIQRISTIVSAMRDFSHYSGERTRVSINKAIHSTLTVARNEWKYLAEVKTELAEDLPQVACYLGDINQVLLNLIVNAAQAIRQRWTDGHVRGQITISTGYAEGQVFVSVADNGCGIPDSIKEKIFDPFFTTKPVGQGTGQGLYLARRLIMERHGGTLNFTSKENEGSIFTITLPLV